LRVVNQLSAHLDRGWDLAQKGDATGAIACARRALELDPQSPEVHNLLGFSAALAGDCDDALDHYKQAIALDETYLEAMLNAAEILTYPMGEWDEAIAMCEDALEYAETPEEIADCVLLKVDALMGKGKTEEAAKAMAIIPEGPFEHPSYVFLIGRAYYEIGQIDKAAPLIEEAVRRDPSSPDAQYYLGLVRDERGDQRGATESFLRARMLDAVRAAPPWSPSPEAFGRIVRSVIEKLDALLGRYVREAEVYVVDVPGAELVVDGVDPRAIMILDRLPPSSSPDGANGVDTGRSVRIFVYQRNVERAAGSLDAIEDELSRALEREITSVFLESDEPPPKHQLN